MKKLVLSPPEFGFVVATRVALAFGIGLLVSRKLSESRARVVGGSLVAVGVLTTIPAAVALLRSRSKA